MANSPNVIGQLSVTYSNRPVIKALLKLVPGGSAVDTLFQKRAEEIKSDRLKVFFDELAEGHQELTDDLIESENFLHSYFCTLRAALNSQQREKIRNFARLLNSSLNPALQCSSDEHEEVLATLQDISLREFAILNDLRKHELVHPRLEGENDLVRASKYWSEFKKAATDKHGIPADSFNAFMARLERTGLYLRITGAFLDYSGDIGTTTPLLARLIVLVQQDD
jgi:hypothetical protein